MFKKVVQQGHSHFDARSVHLIREHGKMARTPLAAFFNIPRWQTMRHVLAILITLTAFAAPPFAQKKHASPQTLFTNINEECGGSYFLSGPR